MAVNIVKVPIGKFNKAFFDMVYELRGGGGAGLFKMSHPKGPILTNWNKKKH